MTVESATSLTEGQRAFLAMAARRGVDERLFGQECIPEIRFQEEEPNPSLPTVIYIHTGGTLMMVPNQGGVLSFEDAVNVPKAIEVCHSMAQVRDRFNLIGVYVTNHDSKDVAPEIWTAIAATIKSLYHEAHGVVVGHGTHTLEESAAGVAYAMRNLYIPVVFTASQMPLVGQAGSDAFGNLTGAMEIAGYGDLAEAVAYANGDIVRGVRAKKDNDERLQVFRSQVDDPVGYLTAAGVEVKPHAVRRGVHARHDLVFNPEFAGEVVVLPMNSSLSPGVLEQILSVQGATAFVLEAFGSGALPKKLVPVISRMILERGKNIFVTSKCTQTGISSGMQGHDQDALDAMSAGIMNVRDMTTVAAMIKLLHLEALMPGASYLDLYREMVKSYAGEVIEEASC